MAVKGGALKAAEELLAMQRAARELDPASPPAAASADPPPARAEMPMRTPLPQAEPRVAAGGHANRVIEAWKAHRAAATASPLRPQHQ
jgi:hypothetical protein